MDKLIRRITCDKCGMEEEMSIPNSLIRVIRTYEIDNDGTLYRADLCPECRKETALEISATIIKFNFQEARND